MNIWDFGPLSPQDFIDIGYVQLFLGIGCILMFIYIRYKQEVGDWEGVNYHYAKKKADDARRKELKKKL